MRTFGIVFAWLIAADVHLDTLTYPVDVTGYVAVDSLGLAHVTGGWSIPPSHSHGLLPCKASIEQWAVSIDRGVGYVSLEWLWYFIRRPVTIWAQDALCLL